MLKRLSVWGLKEVGSALIALGVLEALGRIAVASAVFGNAGTAFLSSPSAPLWFIAAGIGGGLIWVAWPSLVRKPATEQETPVPEPPALVLHEQIESLTQERDALRRDLQTAKAHPPIFFEQVLDLELWDARRALGIDKVTVRRPNPFFFNVEELERVKSEATTLKKEHADAIKAEGEKYGSQIEALLKACAEREQERDAARAQLNELHSLSSERYFCRMTLRLADVIAEGGMLRDKTFEDCTLQGPAVVHFGPGFSNQDPSFTNGKGKLFLISDRVTPGIIYIRDCRFIRCTFANVAVLATEEEVVDFKKRSGMEDLDI